MCTASARRGGPGAWTALRGRSAPRIRYAVAVRRSFDTLRTGRYWVVVRTYDFDGSNSLTLTMPSGVGKVGVGVPDGPFGPRHRS